MKELINHVQTISNITIIVYNCNELYITHERTFHHYLQKKRRLTPPSDLLSKSKFI